jgi:hypothetical protein
MTARRRITQDRNAIWFCALVQIRSAPLLGRPRFRMPGNWRVGVQHDASSINLHFGLVGMQDDNKVPGKNRDVAGISP